MEEVKKKKKIEISLGMAIFLIALFLFIVVAVIMGAIIINKKTNNINDKNIENEVAEYKAIEEIIESVENHNINSNEVSEFEQVYTALTNYLTENKKDLIESNNKIEEIAVTEIEIFDDKYFLGDEFDSESYPDLYSDDNLLIGSCKYALKIPNQEGLELAGSGNMEEIGDWIITTKLFIVEKDTNKVELCTGF